MQVKSFEDLQVWQDARIFVSSIYELTLHENFKKDYGLKDQIQRAAVSIMNNISEGFERDNNREFRNFLGYSKGSAGVNIIKQIANFKKYLRNYIIKEKTKNIKMFILSIIKVWSYNYKIK